METRLITFRKLKSICDDKQARGAVYYCYKPRMDFTYYYYKTGYRLEHREDGFAITVGLMEYISGWSALEILYWLHEKQAIPRRYDNARRQ